MKWLSFLLFDFWISLSYTTEITWIHTYAHLKRCFLYDIRKKTMEQIHDFDISITSWTSHHCSDEILGNRLLSKPFLPSYPRSSCGSFLFLANWLICLASIYWWMHLHLCHDLNDILGMSILSLLNLLFLHSYIRNNDRSDCSHRMCLLSWSPFHTTRLYILAVL